PPRAGDRLSGRAALARRPWLAARPRARRLRPDRRVAELASAARPAAALELLDPATLDRAMNPVVAGHSSDPETRGDLGDRERLAAGLLDQPIPEVLLRKPRVGLARPGRLGRRGRRGR